MAESSKRQRVVGVIAGYRRGGAKQYNNQVIVRVFIDGKDVGSLVGVKAIARDSHGNIYRGSVVKVHSYRNSTVIVRFRPNIPGQLLGSTVEFLQL